MRCGAVQRVRTQSLDYAGRDVGEYEKAGKRDFVMVFLVFDGIGGFYGLGAVNIENEVVESGVAVHCVTPLDEVMFCEGRYVEGGNRFEGWGGGRGCGCVRGLCHGRGRGFGMVFKESLLV